MKPQYQIFRVPGQTVVVAAGGGALYAVPKISVALWEHMDNVSGHEIPPPLALDLQKYAAGATDSTGTNAP